MGRVRLHVGYLGIPAIFELVRHAFLSITFAFRGYSRSVEVHNCRSDRRETGTQIDPIANCNEHQNRKTVFFGTKTEKLISKKAAIAKPKIPMPSSWNLEVHFFLDYCESSSEPWKKLLLCHMAFHYKHDGYANPEKSYDLYINYLPCHLSLIIGKSGYQCFHSILVQIMTSARIIVRRNAGVRNEEDWRIFKEIYCKCKPTAIQQANYTEKVLGNTRT